MGSGGGMPQEGVHKVTVKEASIRRNQYGVSLWMTLTTDGGHKLYDYVALPTAEAAAVPTKYGTKAEFFEKKLKATLCSFGHSPEGIKALTGNGYTGQHLIDWTLNREGNIYYRPPVGSGKHQIDYIGSTLVEKVRSGEITFQDRRQGGEASVQPTVAASIPSPMVNAPVSNGMTTPQPPASGGTVVNSLVGGIL